MAFTLPTLAQRYLEQSGLYNDYINPWLRKNVPGAGHMQDWAEHGYQTGPQELITIPPNLLPLETPNMNPAWLTNLQGEMSPVNEAQISPILEPELLENPAIISAAQEEGANITSPIGKGIAEARRSPLAERYAATPEQKREALGHALIAMSGQLANPQNPTPLAAVAAGMSPALQAYTGQVERSIKHNKEVLELERKAQEAERARRSSMTGLAQEYQSVQQLGEQYGFDSKIYKNAEKALQIKIDNMQSNIDNRYSLMAGRDFKQMPKADQRWLLAMGRAMNINPDDMIKYTNNGYTLNDIAEMHGYDADQVTPDYTPPESLIGDQKKRDAIVAEVQVLNSKVKAAIKPYAATFFGYSPQQVADALKNENVDVQAQYLAARAMAPDLATLEVAAGRGSVSLGMIMDLKETALTDSHIFRPLVTPEVYEKMQEYINAWVTEMTEVAREEALGKHKGSAKKKSSIGLPDFSKMSDEEYESWKAQNG